MNPCAGLIARRAAECARWQPLRVHGLPAAGPLPRAKRQVRFPGIGAAAKALGVTREHAYRVLAGTRQSQSLENQLAKHGLVAPQRAFQLPFTPNPGAQT